VNEAWKKAFPQTEVRGEVGGDNCRYCQGAKRVWDVGGYENADGEMVEPHWYTCICAAPIPKDTSFG